jgi:hypothetical protein
VGDIMRNCVTRPLYLVTFALSEIHQFGTAEAHTFERFVLHFVVAACFNFIFSYSRAV